MRLSTPPLPSALHPRPRRPGEGEKLGPLEQVKEAGIGAVDSIDERKGTNWFYTLGSAKLFAFLSQAVIGVFLAMDHG